MIRTNLDWISNILSARFLKEEDDLIIRLIFKRTLEQKQLSSVYVTVLLLCLCFVRHCLYSYGVCLCRFNFLIDSPTQKEIIGSSLQVMDRTTFLTSTFNFFSSQDQFHLFLLQISWLTESSSRVTIAGILTE